VLGIAAIAFAISHRHTPAILGGWAWLVHFALRG
jgi:hypothetical protein